MLNMGYLRGKSKWFLRDLYLHLIGEVRKYLLVRNRMNQMTCIKIITSVTDRMASTQYTGLA